MCMLQQQGNEADDERFMRIALQHARTAADNGEVPVGAVLASADGRVIAEASNTVKRSVRGSATAPLFIAAPAQGS